MPSSFSLNLTGAAGQRPLLWLTGTLLAVAPTLTAFAELPPVPANPAAISNPVSGSAAASTVQQSAPADNGAAQQVELSAVKDPGFMPYRKLQKGLDAFDKNRARAPQASFQFRLLPKQSDIDVSHVHLRLAGDNFQQPLAVDAQGRFTLSRSQAAYDDNADLLSDMKKDLFRIRPEVRSAGLEAQQRRLGDLRVECEIRWALEAEDLPFFTRQMIRLVGGACHSSNVNVYFPAPAALSAANIRYGDKALPLKLSKDGRAFTVPLHDEQIPDDAIIYLTPA